MRKILKYPIFIFGLLVIILIVSVYVYMVSIGYPYADITGIYWLFGFPLIYSPLLIISAFLIYRKIPKRWTYEIVLIVIYLLVLNFIGTKPEPANEIYLYNQSQPLSKYDQNFIIVFGVEGQPEMDDNLFLTNKINIPKDGIYMTSSTWWVGWSGRKHPWQIVGLNEWNHGAFTDCGMYVCNDATGIKFNYLAMTVNPSDGFDEEWLESVSDLICKKMNDEGLMSDLEKGCGENWGNESD